jgi:hypothetical protein
VHRLPPDADEAELSTLCHEHTARLHQWIERIVAEDPGDGTRTRYDGTVLTACRLYQEHPLSPFRSVKGNTRRYYAAQLGIIERSVGRRRLIRRVTVLDVKRWYDEWRKPAPPPEDATPEQKAAWSRPERVDRAHDCVSVFRTVLHFCAALRHAECKELAAELKLVKFEKGGAREQEMTFAMASAFVRKALEMAAKGLIPAERGPMMAIGVAAQFETMLRQKDVIGEWRRMTRPLAAGRRS